MIQTGLDRLLESTSDLAGRRFALLAHGASVSSDLVPAHVALSAAGVRPTCLFGPEHGFYGVEQDMVPSNHSEDPWTKAPIVSLYGDSTDSLEPDPAVFADLDLLVIDLQDVGARYYTYAATAVWAADAALDAGCEVWVLDRPNPLGGVAIEGNRRRDDLASFVGAFAHPARHGLTLAELVLLESRHVSPNAPDSGSSVDPPNLRIWSMLGWRRSLTWRALGRPWIAPSPNIPTPETALVYPGLCLVEGTELSEGRGTTRPFELVGSPELDPQELTAELDEAGLPGTRFVPTYFRPQFQKHAGRICGGIQVVVTDPSVFPAFRCGVELLAAVRRLGGDQLTWRTKAYEFVSDRPAIDLLAGDTRLRTCLDEGRDPGEWVATWAIDEEAFRHRRREVLIYPEEEQP